MRYLILAAACFSLGFFLKQVVFFYRDQAPWQCATIKQKLARFARYMLNALPLLLLLTISTRGEPARVCVDGTCRWVETGALPSPSRGLPKPAARARVADKKFWLVAGLTVGTAVATTLTINRCRHDHGIGGGCVDGGYGEYRAREALRVSLAVGMAALAWPLKRIEDEDDRRFKAWWMMPVGVAAWNASTIARNGARTFGPREVE